MLHRETYTPTSDSPKWEGLTYRSTTHASQRAAEVECDIVLGEGPCYQPAT
jgi:hypothetical protein